MDNHLILIACVVMRSQTGSLTAIASLTPGQLTRPRGNLFVPCFIRRGVKNVSPMVFSRDAILLVGAKEANLCCSNRLVAPIDHSKISLFALRDASEDVGDSVDGRRRLVNVGYAIGRSLRTSAISCWHGGFRIFIRKRVCLYL